MAITNYARQQFLRGTFDLLNNTVKVMLLTSSHSTNIDTQEVISDVSANEVAGTAYVAGGGTLANKAVTKDNTNDKGVFDADDLTWAASTITARYAVIYKDTGTPSTSPILRIIDFGSNQSSSGGNFTLQWDAGGILTMG